MSFNPASPLQIDVDINTSGTITFETGSANQWGNNRTLTYIAGTVSTTGNTWTVASTNYNFDIDNNFIISNMISNGIANFITKAQITTLTIASACSTNGVTGMVIGTLRVEGSGAYYTFNKAITTVTTNLLLNGSDSLHPVICPSYIYLEEFVSARET